MWLKIFLLYLVFKFCMAFEYDPSTFQLSQFKKRNPSPVGLLRTLTGSPVTVNETISLNSNLLFNKYAIETITHLDGERIPERFVHAKGAGAFGYFEVTHDITDICRADFLNGVGKKTPVAMRLSTMTGSKSSIDTTRDPRGYAVKFYTQEGNWDILGLSSPMIVFKDPVQFASFIHSQKPNPKTGLIDFGMRWDYRSLRQESLHGILYISSDYGIFDGYRRMPGFGIHTFQLENRQGIPWFVRFHFLPDLGNKTLTTPEAQVIGGKDPDYSIRDLYNAIEEGNFPSWTMYVQVLSMEDIRRVDFDPFDITRTIPEDQFPLRPVGKIVLNRNPVNYFAEVEQIAFNPGNLVPGILGAPDKVFEARVLSYPDTHKHRLGNNFQNIPVNCPVVQSFYYYRDGDAPVLENMYDIPNYYPNSFNGPEPIVDTISQPMIQIYTDPSPTNLDQTSQFYANLRDDQKDRLVQVVAGEIVCAPQIVQERVRQSFAQINSDLIRRLDGQLFTNATSYECAKY